MYSACNEGKYVVADRFIRTFQHQKKIYNHMTAVLKNVYFDILDDIVDEYSNTFHRIIKMKPIDFKSNSYAEYNVDSNEKNPNFKIGEEFQNTKTFLLKDLLQVGQKKFLLCPKLKNSSMDIYYF